MPISSSYAERAGCALLTALLLLGSAGAEPLDPAWQIDAQELRWSAVKTDGTARFALELLPAAAQLATTRDSALALMEQLQGFDLQPVLPERGFTFSYTDGLPCQALVSYFDGSQYLSLRICGALFAEDFSRFYQEAAVKLRLQARLQAAGAR